MPRKARRRAAFYYTRRPRGTGPAQYKEVRDEVRTSLRPVGDLIKERFEAVVRDWVNKPKFKTVIRAGRKLIAIQIEITNRTARLKDKAQYGGNIGDLWQWINRGVPRHTIKPRFKKHLYYIKGVYRPKTRPGGLFGGPGTRDGYLIRRRKVVHPGLKARDFTGLAYEKNKKEINRQIRNAYARGLRRALRGYPTGEG